MPRPVTFLPAALLGAALALSAAASTAPTHPAPDLSVPSAPTHPAPTHPVVAAWDPGEWAADFRGDFQAALVRRANGDSDDLGLSQWLSNQWKTAVRHSAESAVDELFGSVAERARSAGFLRQVEYEFQLPGDHRELEVAVNFVGEIAEWQSAAAAWQLRAFANADEGTGANLGVLHRVRYNGENLVGGNAFVDYLNADAGDFWRLSFGVEHRADWMDFHANRYWELSDPAPFSAADGGKFAVRTAEGFDAEAAFRAPRMRWFSAVLGWSRWEKRGARNEIGVRYGGRLEPQTGFLRGMKMEFEYDLARPGQRFGAEFSYTQVVGETPRPLAVAPEFAAADYFFAPVERQHRQNLYTVTVAPPGPRIPTPAPLEAELLQAAENGNAGKVAELLAAGANPNVRNADGNTPLHLAAKGGGGSGSETHSAVAATLLAAGADPDVTNADGFAPLHFAAELSPESAAAGMVAVLAASADPDIRDSARRVPLHLAAGRGYVAVATILANAGADPESVDDQGDTALHHAAYGDADGGGFAHLIQTASVAVSPRNNGGATPLDYMMVAPFHATLTVGSRAVVALFNAAAAVGETPQCGSPSACGLFAIYRAGRSARPAEIEALLDAGASPVENDLAGNTLIDALLDVNRALAVQIAMTTRARCENRCEKVNRDLRTELAKTNPDADVINENLALGADPAAPIPGISDNSPLAEIVLGASPDYAVAETLLAAARAEDSNAVNRPNAAGLNLLQRAVTLSQSDENDARVGWLIARAAQCPAAARCGGLLGVSLRAAAQNSELDSIPPLLAANANINDADSNGRAAVHEAAVVADSAGTPAVTVLQFLLQNGADPDARDNGGETPLHLAAAQAALPAADILLNNEANPNLRNDRGAAPLHHAADLDGDDARGLLRELLRDPRTDINIANAAGETPLFAAWNGDKFAALTVLVEHDADLRKTPPASGAASFLHLALYGAAPDYERAELFRRADSDLINLPDASGDSPLDAFAAAYAAAPDDDADDDAVAGMEWVFARRGQCAAKCDHFLLAGVRENNPRWISAARADGGVANAARADGKRPLNLILESASPDVAFAVALVGDAGFDPNHKVGGANPVQPYLHSAMSVTLKAVFEALLARSDADPNILNDSDLTPLYVAAESGAGDFVRALAVRAGTDLNTISAGSPNPPLIAAAKNFHADIVDELVRRGASAAATDAANGRGIPHIAVYGNGGAVRDSDVDLLRRFIRADFAARGEYRWRGETAHADDNGDRPLDAIHSAGKQNDPRAVDLVRLIADAGGKCAKSGRFCGDDLATVVNADLLLSRARAGDVAGIQAQLNLGADADSAEPGSPNRPALIVAAESAPAATAAESVRVLLAAGADIRSAHPADGREVHHYAALRANLAMLNNLISALADADPAPGPNYWSATDSSGNSPLDLLISESATHPNAGAIANIIRSRGGQCVSTASTEPLCASGL